MQTSPSNSQPHSLADYFLLAILILILAEMCRLLLPLSGGILSAIVIGIAFHPLHLRLSQWMSKRSKSMQAFVTDLLVVLFLIIPTVLLIWVLTSEAQRIAPALKEWKEAFKNLQDGSAMYSMSPIKDIRVWMFQTLGIQPAQFREELAASANYIIERISLGGAALAKNSLSFLLNLAIMLITLFFIFRDGEKMYESVQSYIPLRPELKNRIAMKLEQTVEGVIRGWFVTALVQGIVAALGYFIIGAPAVALLGVLTALVGLIPSIGTALVWLPMGIYYLMQESYVKGTFLLVWGVFVVGLIDNLLRPYLVKSRADLPFLALFIAIVGGAEAWGLKGVLLGPLLVATIPILLDAYRHRYLLHRAEEPKK